jgi:hypothetical protein
MAHVTTAATSSEDEQFSGVNCSATLEMLILKCLGVFGVV